MGAIGAEMFSLRTSMVPWLEVLTPRCGSGSGSALTLPIEPKRLNKNFVESCGVSRRFRWGGAEAASSPSSSRARFTGRGSAAAFSGGSRLAVV
jgi:hypothetical protein